MENPTHLPYHVADVAAQLDGASRDDLIKVLSAAVDQIYFLRAQAAWAATQLERALAYKGFSAYRRSFADTQLQTLSRIAKGEAEKVRDYRRSHRVESAAKRHGIPTWLRQTIPALDTSGPAGGNHALAVGVAYALQEALTLRQVLAYEAGVASAHEIPSGPKGVRSILVTIERVLIESVNADPNALTAELRTMDRKGALRAVGVEAELTNEAFLAAHGLSLLVR